MNTRSFAFPGLFLFLTALSVAAADLELTDEGKALYPEMRAAAIAVINGFLRGFTKTEARQLEGFLKRMLENG